MNTHFSNQEIGQRVAALRKNHNYTQLQLANKINITSKHLSEIERGVTGISIDIQIALSRELHCSLDYLIMGADYHSVDSLLTPYILEIMHSDNQKEIHLFQEYMKLYEKLHKK